MVRWCASTRCPPPAPGHRTGTVRFHIRRRHHGRRTCTPLLRAHGQGAAGPRLFPVNRGVATGDAHSCSINAADTLACWGSNASGQLNNIPSGGFKQVAAGGTHSCAIKSADASLACWGDNPPPAQQHPGRHRFQGSRRRGPPQLRGQKRRHAGLLGQQRQRPARH